MYDFIPATEAALAKAAAWFPLEWVATPFFFWSSVNFITALAAPRALKAPTFWKFSHLK
jgi:hypothetical protein